MKNWGNWSYTDLENVINEARKEGENSISILQEHTDYANDEQVKEWLTQMNLQYKTEVERTIIYL